MTFQIFQTQWTKKIIDEQTKNLSEWIWHLWSIVSIKIRSAFLIFKNEQISGMYISSIKIDVVKKHEFSNWSLLDISLAVVPDFGL